MARRVRSSGPLDLRSQAILRAVIEEYVTTAQPVGSHALVERYRIGVSSATVRSVLSELEASGLLTHPAHAARAASRPRPGYRYYVESMIDSAPLPPVEQLMIRHQFGQVEYASEHWFRLAATTLASLTRAAGIATPAKPTTAHLRHLDLVAISDRLASLILVLREGSLKQVLVDARRADRAGRAERRRGVPQRPPRRPHRRGRGARARPPRRGRSHRRAPPPRGRARGAQPPGVRRRRDRGAVQRRPAQRDGRARVRPEREAPPRVRGAREPRLPRRAHQRRRGLGPRPRLHRLREPGRGDGGRLARARPVRPARAAPSAWSACSGRRAWPTPRRSARSAS